MYEFVIRPALFRLAPERAHNLAIASAAIAGRSSWLCRQIRARYSVEYPRLATRAAGLELANPLGLAAGFDKNGRAVALLDALGFGVIEIGSVSAQPSRGNPRPRLFRLPTDRAVVVNYGVPNDGAEVVASRLHRAGQSCLGVNIVKTNDSRLRAVSPDVQEDYAAAFELLQGHADYVALNLSCPNSASDRDFFDDGVEIDRLLNRLGRCRPSVPVFLKLKPTTDRGALREIVEISRQYPFVSGFAINLPAGKPDLLRLRTPRNRLSEMPGAVAGPPVEDLINEVLVGLRRVVGPSSQYTLMAAGGVSSAPAAYRKLRAGASIVQLYTALIYEGPALVPEILSGLLSLLERDGFERVSDVIGLDVD